jgi:hypothetical protein
VLTKSETSLYAEQKQEIGPPLYLNDIYTLCPVTNISLVYPEPVPLTVLKAYAVIVGLQVKTSLTMLPMLTIHLFSSNVLNSWFHTFYFKLVWNQLLGEGTFVDMGLPSGNLWATSNIDITQPNKFAASPFQYECSFFSWGNIEGHNPISTSAFDYNWGRVNSQEPWYDGQPYGDTAGAGLTTNIPVGETYDAARANLGAPWYIPQSADFQELVNNCIFINADGVEIPSDTTDKRVTVNGIVGLYLQSKTNGNRLFFSASGDGVGTSWSNRVSFGLYRSASFYSARNARVLLFYSGGVYPQDYNGDRYNGVAVRPIAKTSDTIITDPNGHKYYVKNKQNVFDLTKMFGSDANIASALGITTAEIMTSAGVTAFERWLQGNIGPKEYYAH